MTTTSDKKTAAQVPVSMVMCDVTKRLNLGNSRQGIGRHSSSAVGAAADAAAASLTTLKQRPRQRISPCDASRDRVPLSR